MPGKFIRNDGNSSVVGPGARVGSITQTVTGRPPDDPDPIRVLFVAANPDAVRPLALDEEARAIKRKIRESEFRDSLAFVTAWAARPDDLLQKLLQHRPHVVHFSGHGTPSSQLVFVGEDRRPKPVAATALSALFRTLKDNVRVVVLNACYSRPQAEAIVEHIDCAVGMTTAVGDQAAIHFAASFYRAIGFGRSIQEAFDIGKVSIMLEGISGENVPELLVRSRVDPAKIVLLAPRS